MILIPAMTKSRVIGKDNNLPWKLPDDLKNFKRLTSGHTVIMGRKTYESIGRPLPNRNNIVVSSSLQAEGVTVSSSLKEALHHAASLGKEIFIIGGAKVYEQALPLADALYISHVSEDHDGDTFFPPFESDFVEQSRQQYTGFDFVVYKRASPKRDE